MLTERDKITLDFAILDNMRSSRIHTALFNYNSEEVKEYIEQRASFYRTCHRIVMNHKNIEKLSSKVKRSNG